METQEIANSAPSTETELMPAISSASASYSCQTECVVNEIDFKWTIERWGLSKFGIWNIPMTSTEFSDHKFKLELEIAEHDDRYLVIVLHLINSKNLSCPIKVDIAVCNEKCEKIYEKTTAVDISPSSRPTRANVLFMTIKTLAKCDMTKDGEITIHCKIKSLTRKQLTGKAITATERDLHKTPIGGNDQDLILCELEELFEKMPLSDVTFIIRGQKFAAHKTILAMRSPVFAAMFQHPTKEMLSGEVEVEDIDPDVFQEVLRYMYTGLTRSTTMDILAPGLLAAADKYFMDQLKTRCETHLIRQMSVKNCLDLLALTITHHPAEHLKKYAIEYFRRYPGDVMKSNEWKKMKEENPALLCDLHQMVFTAPTV